MQASRYKIQELLDTQGAVSTYQALDTLSNEPVLYYQYLSEPLDNAAHILSDNIPNILNMQFKSGMTHVVTVSPPERKHLKKRLEDSELEQFLLDTAQALEDASDAAVLHGDIRPERLLYDGNKYFIEGYGIRWELLPSRYCAPEKKQTVAADVYSWAKTVGAFVPFSIPVAIADLLERCLLKDPKARPLPEDIVDELTTFFTEAAKATNSPPLIDLKGIANAQADLLDNILSQGKSEILTNTQERFVKAIDVLKKAKKVDDAELENDTPVSVQQPEAQISNEDSDDLEDIFVDDDFPTEENVEVQSNSQMQEQAQLKEQAVEDIESENLTATQERLARALGTLHEGKLPQEGTPSDSSYIETNIEDNVEASIVVLDTDIETSLESDTKTATEDNEANTQPSVKLSTADLASGNLKDISELRESRADLSGMSHEDASTPELSSAARINTNKVTNQSISNEETFLVSEKSQEKDTTDSPKLSKDIALNINNVALNPDTIDQSLVEIANADTTIGTDDPFLAEDDFSDLLTQVGAETQVSTNDLKQDTEVVITSDFTTTKENTTDLVDSDVDELEITGLDAIEHKATFEDLNEVQVELLDSKQLNSDQLNANNDIAQNAMADVDLNSSPKSLTQTDQETQNNATNPAAENIAVDLESQAIEDIFPETPENINTTTGFDVSDLDFSGDGFNETTVEDTPTDSVNLDSSNSDNNSSSEEANHFDATSFNLSDFDSEATSYNATVEEEAKNHSDDFEAAEKVISDISANSHAGNQSAPDTTNQKTDAPDVMHLTDTKEIDLNSLLPNSTQLERAFAAISNPSTKEIDSANLDTLDALPLDSLGIQEPDVEIPDSHLTEAASIFDSLPDASPNSETESIELQDLSTKTSQNNVTEPTLEAIDSNSEDEDLTLIDTDFSEVQADTIVDSLATPDSDLQANNDIDTSEDLMSLDEDLTLIDTDFSETQTSAIEDRNIAQSQENKNDKEDIASLKDTKYLLAFDNEELVDDIEEYEVPEVTPTKKPALDNYIDDLDDDAAQAYLTQYDSSPDSKNASGNTDVKATQEILHLLGDEDLETTAAPLNNSVVEQTPQKTINLSTSEQDDDLDTFIGDVLENQNNSLQTENSALNSAVEKETLFPVYTDHTDEETIFDKETVFALDDEATGLEPNTNSQNTDDSGIFSHTEFSSPDTTSAIKHLSDENVTEDDDLQVIEITEFDAPASTAINSTPTSSITNTDQSTSTELDTRATARLERKAKRAKRRAEAEAAEAGSDEYSTAFGKIAQMQESAQKSPSNEAVKETVDLLLTAADVDESSSSPSTIIDETKLTAHEAKHLTIAEKIAAKKVKAQTDVESKKTLHQPEPLKKTELGRSSRKQQVFEEDDYDAIGKLPAQKASPAQNNSNPKLTYFEMPTPDDEVPDENENPTKAKATGLRGFFKKKQKKQKETTLFETQPDDGYSTGLDTDIGSDSDNLKITAERQEEFNKALGASTARNIWRGVAAALVLVGAGAIILLTLPGLKNAQESFTEQSITRETENILGISTDDYMVYTQVLPENLEDVISVVVLQRPENSKYPVGHVFNIFPNTPLSLDVKGEWHLQARYMNRFLSNNVAFELPKLGGEPIIFGFNVSN